MKKFCVEWVPRLLNFDNENKRVHLSKDNLALIKGNKYGFLRRFVMMTNERWIHYYTSESNGSPLNG